MKPMLTVEVFIKVDKGKVSVVPGDKGASRLIIEIGADGRLWVAGTPIDLGAYEESSL